MQNSMIMPETSENKIIKAEKSSEDKPKRDFIQKKIHGYQMHEIVLNPYDLESHRLKRIDPIILKFKARRIHLFTFVNDNHLRMLGMMIKSSNRLRELEIDIERRDDITDRGLQEIWKSIRGSRVRRLTLNFECLQFLRNKGVKNLSQALKALTSLQSIDLNFERCNLGNKELVSVGLGLRRLIALRSIKLNLAHCKIDDKEMQNLYQTLKNLIFLENIHVIFSGKIYLEIRDNSSYLRISDVGMSTLGQALKRLARLKMIDLDFENCKCITNQGISNLCSGLEKCDSLKSLSLNFGRNDNITKDGLDRIGQIIKTLSCLEALGLGFRGCCKISDESRSQMMQDIKNHSCLERLDLNFCGCEQIINNRELFSLPASLRSIKLDFSDCREMVDFGLENLGVSLAAITNLKSLSLVCTGCSKISIDGIENFTQYLNNLKTLESLNLNFKL